MIRCFDLFRAVTGFNIVLYHAGLLDDAVSFALFLMLSGFLPAHRPTYTGAGLFLFKRLMRLAPLYWLITVLLFVTAPLQRNSHWTWRELGLSLAFIPYRAANGHIWPILIPGWTLNLEMLLSLICALGIVSGRPRAVPVVTLITLSILGWLIAPTDPVALYLLSPLLVVYAFGFVAAEPRLRLAVRPAVALLALAVAIWAGFIVWHVNYSGTLGNSLLRMIPSALALIGALSIEEAGLWPVSPTLAYFGKTSFAVYLVHDPVLSGFGRIYSRVHGPAWLGIMIAIGLSYVVAHFAFHLVEEPIRKRLQDWLIRRAVTAPAG